MMAAGEVIKSFESGVWSGDSSEAEVLWALETRIENHMSIIGNAKRSNQKLLF